MICDLSSKPKQISWSAEEYRKMCPSQQAIEDKRMSDRIAAVAEKFSTNDFRVELTRIMPGFNWTVHRASKSDVIFTATGIQSSGFNRLATLRVDRDIRPSRTWYTAKIAEHGTRAPFGNEGCGATLARALRDLQKQCQSKASTYQALVSKIEAGRKSETAP